MNAPSAERSLLNDALMKTFVFSSISTTDALNWRHGAQMKQMHKSAVAYVEANRLTERLGACKATRTHAAHLYHQPIPTG